MKRKCTVFDVAVYAILLVMALLCALPLLNTLAMSLSDKTSAAAGKVLLLPKNFTVNAYSTLIQDRQYWRSFLVSVERVLLGGGLNMLMSILMAYPLSKGRHVFPACNIYKWLLVFTMIFAGGLIPNYLLISSLGLMNTLWALVLPGAVPAFNVIILMNFFKGVPKTLEEAAMVEGANPLQILLQIYLPLSMASLATISLFSIVSHWNSYFDGKIYINTVRGMPLQTYIQSLSATLSAEQMANMSEEEIIRHLEVSDLTFNCAKVFVAMIPVLSIYPLLQRYFVTGLVMGAVKE